MEEYRVLLVDDEEDIRVGISRKMDWAALGFSLVGEAENGQEALDLFRASAPGRYDLILMDIQMPVMNGCDAARAIRGLSRPDAAAVPILAMSANAFAEDIAASREAGMNEHMAKPLDIAQLSAVMGRWMGV